MNQIIRKVAKRILVSIGYVLISEEVFESYLQLEKASQGIPPEILCKNFHKQGASLIFFDYGILELCDKRNTFWATHDSGLFSCLTTTINTLTMILPQGRSVNVVRNTLNMNYYKNTRYSETWNIFFRDPSEEQVNSACYSLMHCSLKRDLIVDHHSIYSEQAALNRWHEWLYPIIDGYLSPSVKVKRLANFFLRSYNISASDTLAVYFRGTDKSKEIAMVAPAVYFQEIDGQLSLNPKIKLFIQTDEMTFWQACLARYGSRCVRLTELPLSSNGQPTFASSSSRLQDGLDLLAAVKALGHCGGLVTNSGNVALFLAIEFLRQNKPVTQLI